MKRFLAIIISMLMIFGLAACGNKQQSSMVPADEKEIIEEQKEKVDNFADSYTDENIHSALAGSNYISEEFELNVLDEVTITLDDGKYNQIKTKHIRGKGIKDELDYFNLIMKYNREGGVMDCAISIDVDKDEIESAKQEVLNIIASYTNDSVKNIALELMKSGENSKIVTTDSGDVKVSISLEDRIIQKAIDITDEDLNEAVEMYQEAVKNAANEEEAKKLNFNDFLKLSEDAERSIFIVGVELLEFMANNTVDFLTVEGGMLDIVNNCPVFYSHSSDLLSRVSYNNLAYAAGFEDITVESAQYTESNGIGKLLVYATGSFQDNTTVNISIEATKNNYTVRFNTNYGDINYIKQIASDIATELYGYTAADMESGLTEIANTNVSDLDPINGKSVMLGDEITVDIKNIDVYGSFASITLHK